MIRFMARHSSKTNRCDSQTSFMQYIHSRNFIHRDIRMDNPLTGIGKRGNQVNVIDCGLANTARNPKTYLHIRCLSLGQCVALLITPVWKAAYYSRPLAEYRQRLSQAIPPPMSGLGMASWSVIHDCIILVSRIDLFPSSNLTHGLGIG
ncbi:serine/threonine protein kinase [Ceratobasidium sp. 395]|nr:serine/threonine protein kinase [Ceratobasidium sp. 395]